jgi:hypothetical protein
VGQPANQLPVIGFVPTRLGAQAMNVDRYFHQINGRSCSILQNLQFG